MSIRRAPRKTTYTNIDNAVFNAGLSYRAIGLLCFLLSKPDHWEVSIGHLTKYSRDTANPIGRDAIYSVLRELEDKGFIVREQKRNEDGKMAGMDYVVFDQPQEGNCLPGIVPDEPEPLPGNPFTDKPSTAISTQVNTDTKVNTESKSLEKRRDAHEEATPEQLDKLFSPQAPEPQSRFSIPLNWRPDRDKLEPYCMNAGCPTASRPDQLIDGIIGDWVNYWHGDGTNKTEAQWFALLAGWLKRKLAEHDSGGSRNQTGRNKSYGVPQRNQDFESIDHREGGAELGLEVI